MNDLIFEQMPIVNAMDIKNNIELPILIAMHDLDDTKNEKLFDIAYDLLTGVATNINNLNEDNSMEIASLCTKFIYIIDWLIQQDCYSEKAKKVSNALLNSSINNACDLVKKFK